jgi:TolB-like protein/Flp pilus assembly protein TadD
MSNVASRSGPSIRHISTFLAKNLTTWATVGAVIALTGFGPEHWFAATFRYMPSLESSWPLWLDVRVVIVCIGVAIVVADLLLRRRAMWQANKSGDEPVVEGGPAQRPFDPLPVGGTLGSSEHPRPGREADHPPARTAPSVKSDAALHEEPPPTLRPSVAVLPFDNLSGDPQQDYFSDGIVEEIITALTRTSWLFVIARNSSFTYKGRAVDVKQVGRELGVHYVLEGSLRKSANRVRITCQLIDASNGMHIWADRYDGALEDIFDLQDQVTANLVSAIAPQLQRAAIERARRKPTENLSSYDYFLRGMANSHQWNAEASNDALRHFHKAVTLDPEFATAYGMAAWCYVWRIAYGWIIDAEQEYADAVRLARRAIELGPDDAVALGCGGWVLGYVGRELEAGAAFVDRARALNPSHAPTWYFSGWLSVFLGDPEAAIPHFAQVMRLSPRDPLIFHMQNGTAWAHFFAGRCDEALSWAERALRESPNCKPALRISAASQALLGRMEDARVTIGRMRQVDPEFRVRDLRKVAPFRRPEDLTKYEGALRKAGLPD